MFTLEFHSNRPQRCVWFDRMGKQKQKDARAERHSGEASGTDLPVLSLLGHSLARDATRLVDELTERDERGMGAVTKPIFAKTRPLLAALIQRDVSKSDVDALFEALDVSGSGAVQYREIAAFAAQRWGASGPASKGGKSSKGKAAPGKLGFEGVEDDGAAQSKFKGLSSGAKAALRRKLQEERTSGEAEAEPLPPPAPANFVDCLFFASELFGRREALVEAAQAAYHAQAELAVSQAAAMPPKQDAAGSAMVEDAAASVAALAEGAPSAGPPSGVLDSLRVLSGARCDGAIGAYQLVAELDARAGDLRYRCWEEHGLPLAAFGLEPRGLALVGAAAGQVEAAAEAERVAEEKVAEAKVAAATAEAEAAAAAAAATTSVAGSGGEAATGSPTRRILHDPLAATLREAWATPRCAAAGPMGLDYSAASELSDEASRAAQRRGLSLLLPAALAAHRPVILYCRGGLKAERDLAAITLSALAAAPPPPTPPPAAAAAAERAWRPCTPLLCHDAGELWARLHAGWPGCAYLVLDGTVTFGKASRELLGLAFDVPTSRLLFASAAPRHRPAQAGDGAGRKGYHHAFSHPGHIVHTAEKVAAVRTIDAAPAPESAATLLHAARESARALFPALGLVPLDESGGVATHEGSDVPTVELN